MQFELEEPAMSISMPSYFMFNLSRMDDLYRQTIWDSMTEEEQKSAAADWKALHDENGSAYGKGPTTISATPPEPKFNSDTQQLGVSRNTTYSADPTAATLTGFNKLLSSSTVSGLVFVDLVNANTDASRAELASAAYGIMSSRYGGSQGVLGVDLNGNGYIDDVSELFGSQAGDRAGHLDFTIDVSRLSAGDSIAFSVARALGGAEQTYLITTETSLQEIADGINQAVLDGTLSGVGASVVDGRLRLTATDPVTGLADVYGTLTGSLTDRTGDVTTPAAVTAGDGVDVPGHADYAFGSAVLSAGDEIRFTLDGGMEQVFTLTGSQDVDALVEAINQAVTDGTLSGVVASSEDGVLRLTAADPAVGISAGAFVDRTADVTTAGAAFLSNSMQRLSDYVSVGTDGSVTWTSEKKAMLLSSSGASAYTNLSLSGLINGTQATVDTALVLAQNQGARINVAV
jgi:hypothetical protein